MMTIVVAVPLIRSCNAKKGLKFGQTAVRCVYSWQQQRLLLSECSADDDDDESFEKQ